jgi:lipoprotein NlpI
VRYAPSNLAELFAPPGNARRSFPLAVPAFPYSYEYDFELTLPASSDLGDFSNTRTVDDPAFGLRRKLDSTKRTMHVNVTLDTRADRVQPGRLPQYLKNMQQYNDVLGGTLHVPKPGAPRAAAPARLAAEARLEQSLLAMGRVISDADATGRDPTAALCERALVQAYLERKAEAQKDLARALQLQPQSDALLRCRADVNYLVGRFQESEADYSKAMARGADQAAVWLGRGLAALYQSKSAAAQADFLAAGLKAEDDPERMRAVILNRIAGGAAPVPAGVADVAWLVSARALFDGTVEPEHMVSEASRGLVEGNSGQLVETYFYAGRYHLAKGNAIKARVYFQRALDKRVLDNPYHVAARHELARMQGQH